MKAFKFLILFIFSKSLLWASYTKMPEFRKAFELPNSINNPFLDSTYNKKFNAHSDLDGIKSEISKGIFETQFSGISFKNNGTAVGIILGNTFYREADVFEEHFSTSKGVFRLSIKKIKPSYITLFAEKEISPGNYGYGSEIIINLPDLKK